VRKAVVASLGVSDVTLPALVDRTRDVAEDVRRTTFRTLAGKVPLAVLSIAQRTTVLRRGLADRAPPVREAAIGVLDKWMQACEGDVARLLGALDVENRESVSEALLKEFITCGVVNAAEVAQRDAATHGLRRDVATDGPLSPELALYWRVICEALSAEAKDLGTGAATGGGQAAAVAAASASEKLEALDAALPESMAALCALIRGHADVASPGTLFATRQLLRLARTMDLSDATASREAGALADQLMRRGPVQGGATLGSAWESALAGFASAALGAAAPGIISSAAVAVRDSAPEDVPCWLHALALVAALLEDASSLRAAGGSTLLRSLLQELVLPAVQHGSVAVRARGMRCLGLICLLDLPLDTAYVALLRHAAACDARLVRTQATRALCDLALLHGMERLDAALPPAGPGPNDTVATTATAPLLAALQQCLQEPAQGLAAPAAADDGCPDAEDVEEEPRTVAAEGLAKLLLLSSASSSSTDAGLQAVLAQLIVLHQAADEHSNPRLAQCLTVFLPMFASASAQHKRVLVDVTLPALRLGAKQLGAKRLPKLAAALQRLVSGALAAPRPDSSVPPLDSVDTGMTALAQALLAEATAAEAHFVRNASMKPYLSALVRTACATTPHAPSSLADPQARTEQAQAIARLRACARMVGDRLGDKTLSKDLTAWSIRLGTIAGEQSSGDVSDEVALSVLTSLHEYWLANVASTLPFAAEDGARPTRRATRSKAADPAPAATSSRPTRATRGTVKAAIVFSEDEDEEASDFEASSGDDEDEEPARRNQGVVLSKRVTSARTALTENIH